MKKILVIVYILPIMFLQASQDWLESEAVLTMESVTNLKGGLEQKTGYLENIDLTFSVDSEKADLWSNGTLFIYFLNNTGDNPTDFIGDTQGSSNIESYDTFKLYEFWYEQNIGELSILFGLHDYNSEFDALDGASLLFGSSFGISPDISQMSPSIFPTTSLALRVLWQNETGIYIRSAVYDGIPGNPEDENGTHVILGKKDGLFYGVESGIESEGLKFALGAWYHASEVVDFSGIQRDANGGFYAIGEFNIGGNNSLFFQSGHAQSDRNAIDNYIGVGWHTSALFASDDEAGIGIARAMPSDTNKSNNNLENAETAYELTYSYTFNDNLTIKPSFQYISSPSMSKTIDDATIFACRAELSF